MKPFNVLIRERRLQLGISQTELAEIIGTTKSAICRYENGSRIPTSDIFVKLAACLQLDDNDIISIGKPVGISSAQISNSISKLFVPETEHLMNLAKRKGVNFDPSSDIVLMLFADLNDNGKKEAIKRLQELTEIPRYRADVAAGAEDPADDPADKD